VLDYSRIEAERMQLYPEPFDLERCLHEVMLLLQPAAREKGLRLLVDFDLFLPTRFIADPGRMRQVLTNLIGNAVKFTDRGAVSVQLTEQGQTGERLRIEVIDSGPGLSDAHRKRLFQRFAQGDSSVTRRHGGSGLGLAICRELVDLMGGHIGAENRDQPGACFWVDIPAPAVCPALSRPADSPHNAEAPGLEGRVLIVDDHPVNRELVRLFLASPGVVTAEADNGRAAIERASIERFDLILMDVNMPVMDGLAAASAIRASCPLNADTPIVALTAQTGAEIEQKCFDAGMDAVLAKPIAQRDLLALATQAMSPGRQEAAA